MYTIVRSKQYTWALILLGLKTVGKDYQKVKDYILEKEIIL